MIGLELMLAGIYAFTNNNTLNYTLDHQYRWEVSLDDIVSWNYNKTKAAELYDGGLPEELLVTTWDEGPYSSYNNVNGKIIGGGYAFQIFDIIAEKLNFKYRIIPPEDLTIGNNETGMINMLNQSKVDMAVAFIPIIPEYMDFVEFSPILDSLEVSVLLKRPLQSAIGSGLLAPFSKTVWICIFVSLALVGPIIYFVTSFRTWLWDRTNKDRYSFIDCVWFAYGAILKQGSAITPEAEAKDIDNEHGIGVHKKRILLESNSNRLLFASWWIFITIITAFYTANLTAFLTLSEFTLDFTSVKDIYNLRKSWTAQRHYIIDITVNRNHPGKLEPLKKSLNKTRGMFYNITKEDNKAKKVAGFVTNDRLFIDEIQFIEDFIYRDYVNRTRLNMIEKEKCYYIKMPNSVYEQNRGFAYPLNSRLKKIIDYQLLHLIETGIIKHIESVNRPMVTYCPLDLGSTERRLENRDFKLTYEVIATGFLLALICFIVEVSQHYFKCRVCLCCADSCTCCKTRMKIQVSPTKRPQLPLPPLSITKGPIKTEFSAFPQPQIPIYDSIDNVISSKTHFINGRDYFVIKEITGEKRLVPVRTPSALLFQYTN